MSRALALPEQIDTADSDQIVVFHDVTWEDYERVLEIRGDKSAPRINYLEGELEIMSPSRDHEQIKNIIGHIVEAWCIDHGIRAISAGSWTVKGQEEDGAAEADECYIFGTAPRDRPQLAIEVDWSRGSIDKLRLYEKLGVDEVWICRKGVIEVHVLAGKRFVKAERSRLLPALDLELLASVLDRDSITDAVLDFRKASEGA